MLGTFILARCLSTLNDKGCQSQVAVFVMNVGVTSTSSVSFVVAKQDTENDFVFVPIYESVHSNQAARIRRKRSLV
jgi:hypothetical protein